VYTVLKPTLSEDYDQGNIKRVQNIIKLSIKYMVLLSVPFFFGILLFHQEITALLSTEEIAKEGSFIAIFTSITGLVYIFQRFTTLALALAKKTKILGGGTVFAAILNLVGNMILIPSLGIAGAATTTLISYSVVTVIYALFSKRYISLKIDLLEITKIIVSAVGMYISLYIIISYQPIYFLYLVPVGVLIYFGILISFKGISREEIGFLKKLASRNN